MNLYTEFVGQSTQHSKNVNSPQINIDLMQFLSISQQEIFYRHR